jgi:tetratricopeptide (TPR) repeat protein
LQLAEGLAMHRNSRIALVLAAGAALAQLSGCDAGSSATHFRASGARLLAANEPHKAQVQLNHALSIDPHDARAHYLAGRIAERLQDPDNALEHFQTAIDRDPSLLDARASAGRTYLYLRLVAKALEVARQGLELAPDDPQLLAVRAAARAENDDFDGAIGDAAAAARARPDDAVIIGLQSNLYRRAGQLDRAIEAATRAVERAPWSIPLRYALVDALTSARREAEARTQMQEIVATEPRVAVHRLRLAQLLADQHDAAAAEQVLRDGIAATSDSSLKLALIKLVARNKGPAASQAGMQRLLDVGPYDDDLYLLLGAFSEQTGDADEAEQLYRAVVTRANARDRSLTARPRLARLRFAASDATAATRLTGEVLEVRPAGSDAMFLRAELAMAGGDVRTAVANLRATLESQPSSPLVLRELARAYQLDGQPDVAEQTLRTTLTRHPADAASFEQLFRLQLQRNDTRGARETAAGLQQAHPERALGFYLAGLADEAEQHSGSAIAEYDRALQLQPQVVEPLTVIVRLQLAAQHPERRS